MPVLSEAVWVSPSNALPKQVVPMASNNNVGITLHEGELYLAFRTSPTHFASVETVMHIIRSEDLGASWIYEATVSRGVDLREPHLVSWKGTLAFYFFEAGTSSYSFQPKSMLRMERKGPAGWTEPEAVGEPGEVPWDIKQRDGRLFLTSYKGSHYKVFGDSQVALMFKTSEDGITWTPVGRESTVYFGGVSEATFDWDLDGRLWAVTRNEDGDDSGFGSHLVRAAADDYGKWNFPAHSDPERYDSPKMFRQGAHLYLVARRDVGGPFDKGWNALPLSMRRILYWVAYSLRPKRTALYWIDRKREKVVHLFDFPRSSGDTAFPSVVRLDQHRLLVANYTGGDDDPEQTWFSSQISDQGTRIYLVTLTFPPEAAEPQGHSEDAPIPSQ
jgi:hypothetical protein